MKKIIYLLSFALIASTAFVSCDDDNDEKESDFKIVTLGAQENTDIDGFYSFNNEKTYTMEEAFQNQATIDLLCFYEDGKNDITLSSPGANITDVFTGDNAPTEWATQDTTYFFELTDFTAIQFAALSADDATIETLYNAEEGRRKAKLLEANDIYAFQTEDNYYGILMVNSVTQGTTGSVNFTYILKK